MSRLVKDKSTIWKVDQPRLDAFDQALRNLCEQYGFVLTQFDVEEFRQVDYLDIQRPEITISLVQNPSPESIAEDLRLMDKR